MKIKINNDIYKIVSSIKAIDKNYLVYYSIDNNRFELFSKSGLNINFELNLGKELDIESLKKVYTSRINSFDNMLEEIERQNAILKDKSIDKELEEQKNKMQELLNFIDKKNGLIDFNKLNFD